MKTNNTFALLRQPLLVISILDCPAGRMLLEDSSAHLPSTSSQWLEIWPNTDGTSRGYLDIRGLGGTASVGFPPLGRNIPSCE